MGRVCEGLSARVGVAGGDSAWGRRGAPGVGSAATLCDIMQKSARPRMQRQLRGSLCILFCPDASAASNTGARAPRAIIRPKAHRQQG
eukprot:scaffold32567_cov123-Isochrysis_galbana.AAC.3